MHSSSLDLPLEKHLGVSNPPYQVDAQWSKPFWDCMMGWVMGSASASPPPPSEWEWETPWGSDPWWSSWVDPPKWGIVQVNLVPVTHPPNFCMIAAIGKKLIFWLHCMGSLDMGKMEKAQCSQVLNDFLHIFLDIVWPHYIQKMWYRYQYWRKYTPPHFYFGLPRFCPTIS